MVCIALAGILWLRQGPALPSWLLPLRWGPRLSQEACPRHAAPRTVRRARGGGAVGSASGLLADCWREEAERCWAPGEDGAAPGFLADMVPAGQEYDPLTRIYIKTDKKPEPQEPRPWRRLEGEAAAQAVVPGDERAEDFAEALRFFGREGAEAGGAVLDVGCGEAYMARRMAQSGRFDSVFAFDVDWRQLEAARTAAEEDRLSPEKGLFLLRADAQELPFRDGLVDFAWWGMGMHKVKDAGAALKAVSAALRPGGRLMATTIPSSLPGRRPEDVESKAREAGFSEVTVLQPRPTEIVLQAVK